MQQVDLDLDIYIISKLKTRSLDGVCDCPCPGEEGGGGRDNHDNGERVLFSQPSEGRWFTKSFWDKSDRCI